MKIFGFDIARSSQNETHGANPSQGYGTVGSFGVVNSWARSKRSDFENQFASVNAIIDEIYGRKTFATDLSGNEIKFRENMPLLWALDHPNDRMNGKKFLSTMISGYLVLPEVNMLLWHFVNGGKNENGGTIRIAKPGAPKSGFNSRNIAGFTILPRGSRTVVGGEELFKVYMPDGFRYFSRKEVISLRHSILPDDGITGISPGSSSHQEAQIADYIGQQQRAMFENGARPELLVTFHARNIKEGELLQQKFEKNYRGARNAGGTVYQTVISDGVDGNGEARIEVTPIGVANNTLAITDLVNWTDGKIEKAQGVSPLMMGQTDAVAWNIQQTVKANFYTKVDNILARFYGDLKFELERITRETLPFEFGFEVRNIEITDEQKVIADTRVANVSAYTALIDRGESPSVATAKLGLPATWAINGGIKPISELVPQNMFSAAESNSREPVYLSPQKSIEKSADASTGSDVEDHVKTGAKTRVADRRPENIAKIKEILTNFAKAKLSRKENHALSASDQKYVNFLLAELQEMADEGGIVVANQLAQQIKGQVISRNYEISQATLESITARAKNVIGNFANFVDEQRATGLASSEILASDALTSRISTIAISETKNAFQNGQLDNAQQISNDANVVITKEWAATGSEPCEFCAGMHGTEAGIQDSFVPGGVIYANGEAKVLDPNYSDGTLPDAHANCQCTFVFNVEESN